MQRGQVATRFNLGQYVVVDKHRTAEVFAAMYHAVANGANFVEAFHRRSGVSVEHFEQLGQAVGYRSVRHFVGLLFEVGREADVHEAVFQANLFGQALHGRFACFGFNKLAFQAGATSVHHKNKHGNPFP